MMMTRTERLLAVTLFFTALVSIALAFPGTAYAGGYCIWELDCEFEPGVGTVCQVVNYNCSPFIGDCDWACDAEYADCLQDCQSEGGVHCGQTCNPIYTACIGSCIPWVR